MSWCMWMRIIFVSELVVLLCSLAVELIGGCSHLFSAQHKQLYSLLLILLSGVITLYCIIMCIDNTRLMVVSCGGDWLVLYCVELMVLFELLLSCICSHNAHTHTAPPTSCCTSVPFSHCFCLLFPPGTDKPC